MNTEVCLKGGGWGFRGKFLVIVCKFLKKLNFPGVEASPRTHPRPRSVHVLNGYTEKCDMFHAISDFRFNEAYNVFLKIEL